MPESRVLVTGATGFVGRHLTRTLDAAGWHVHALVRQGSCVALDHAVMKHEVADSVTDTLPVIDEVQPTLVLHLATLFAAEHEPNGIRAMIDANVTFGTVVAEGCCRVGATLVRATSSWQHYQGADYSPVSLYAATKQAFDDILAYYAAVAGLRTGEVCLFDTYGPGDTRHKLVWLLLNAARTGEPLLLGSGKQLIDLTHVDDVARAFLISATEDVERIVVRSGEPVTIRDLASLVQDVTGRKLAVRWGARPDRPREMYTDWRVTSTPTSWRPSIRLAEGLEALWRSEFA